MSRSESGSPMILAIVTVIVDCAFKQGKNADVLDS
jgi:hypothetical protein